jgi:hypothetical protein
MGRRSTSPCSTLSIRAAPSSNGRRSREATDSCSATAGRLHHHGVGLDQLPDGPR